ncbi:reverse transcriptase domain-containing protein [Tanacetum coccineum]|uniref:Reverse transcriptase domain-containing protein n=1 Tax=Tanacetum coccineum TaxID=301880 RepID=A0ABQ4WNJ2_9ASTR
MELGKILILRNKGTDYDILYFASLAVLDIFGLKLQAAERVLFCLEKTDVRSAYVIISSEESHRVASGRISETSQRTQTCALTDNVPNKRNFQSSQTSNNFPRPFNTVRPNDNGNRRTARGSNLVCEHCAFNGHIIDRCFKINGYPDEFGNKKAGQNFKAKNVFNNVVGSSSSTSFSDEQLSTLISLIKETSVNGKGVQANMAGSLEDIPSEITQEVLNAAAGGIFLYKTPNQAYQLLEDKVLLKLDWAKNNKTKSSLKKTVAFANEVNLNDQQNDSETPINFDSDEEDEEPKPQPKTQNPKPVKETPLPKPYKPKIPYPQCLRKEKMEAQYGKFLDMIRAVRINVPLIDVLAGMPNYGKFLKELISNKHKIEQISAAFLSDESSAMIQNKVPPKLGDPGSFLIPCNFNKTFSCNALADLGASINLMPYSLYAKLSLETLKPTKMSVRLADRSFQYPVGIAENMLVEVGKFTFPADFVILEMEEDSKVPLILGRPFLHTADAVIRVKQKQLNLGVGTERMIFNIDSAMKHSYLNDDTCFSIDVIDEILEEESREEHA